jgi:hypothetical protein
LRVARGLFRLWLVLSVLWIGGVGVMTWRTLPESELPSFCDLPANERSEEIDCSWLARVKRHLEFLDPRLPSWAMGPEREAVWFATLLALIPPAFVLALGSALVWAFKGFSLTSKGADARSGRLNHPNRPYSEMLEAAQRKLSEAQFFHRRLVHERDGRLVESEAGAFRHHLSAFLSAGESVVYVLKNADLTKYTAWLHGLPEETDRELLTFMNLQRGEEIHGKGLDVTAKLEPVPPIVLIRSSQHPSGHPAYGAHFFGPLGSQIHPMRSVLYFTGDEEDLIRKCAKYLGLLQMPVQKFIQTGQS